ncbi:MAG: glutathione S-transferase family protein [Bdellovibrionales bacterium]|nr:glutathione S-transferase family protein [Bdellovibrionales bacterium]
MSYTLIGSLRSPFVRTCRLLMLQHGLDFHFRVLNFVDDEKDAAALAKETPINKVPVLVDGEQKVFDSRVIVSYLAKKHAWPELSIDDENRISVIYSCMDASVILFLMRHDKYDMQRSGFFLSRQRARIVSNIEYLSPWIEALDPRNPKHWNYPTMSLFSYIFWAEKRELLVVGEYPVLERFMNRFAQAPGVRETTF